MKSTSKTHLTDEEIKTVWTQAGGATPAAKLQDTDETDTTDGGDAADGTDSGDTTDGTDTGDATDQTDMGGGDTDAADA